MGRGELEFSPGVATLSIIRDTSYVILDEGLKKNRKGWGKKKKRKKREKRGKKRGKWANKHADAWRMPIDFHFRSRKSRGCVSSTLWRVRIVLGRIVWMGKRTHIRLSEQLDSVSFLFSLSLFFFSISKREKVDYSNSNLIRGFVDCGSI